MSGDKLLSALYKLIEDDFCVSDSTILDKLIYQIKHSYKGSNEYTQLLPKFGDWLVVVMKRWSSRDLLLDVKLFSLGLISVIGSSKNGFEILNNSKVLQFLQNLSEDSDIDPNYNYTRSLIRIFKNFLEYEIGYNWIINTMVWQKVMKLHLPEHSCYSTRKSKLNFIHKMLIASERFNIYIARDLMNWVCEPFVAKNLLKVEMLDSCDACEFKQMPVNLSLERHYRGEQIQLNQDLVNCGKNLLEILEFLESVNFILPVKLLPTFRETSDKSKSVFISDILENCDSPEKFEIFSSLLLAIELVNTSNSDGPVCGTYCSKSKLINVVDQIIEALLSRQYFKILIEFAALCLYKLHNGLVTIKRKLLDYKYEPCKPCFQLESLLVSYLAIFLNPIICSSENRMVHASIWEYVYQNKLLEDGSQLCFYFLHVALSMTRKCYKTILYDDNKVLLIQGVNVCFSEVIKQFEQHRFKATSLIIQLLHLVGELVSCPLYLTWRLHPFFCHNGSAHTIFSSLQTILGIRTIDNRVTIVLYQTINKIVVQYRLPKYVGRVPIEPNHNCFEFYKNPHFVGNFSSRSWEVRDSVIETFDRILEVSGFNGCWDFFGSHKKVLLEQIYPSAMKDDSSYVRASAMNLFSRIVLGKHLITETEELPQMLLELALEKALTDEIPLVRKSACGLLTSLYISYFPDKLKNSDQLFDAVYKVSVKDLDWEVKNAALKFWHCTLNRHLMETAMLPNPLQPIQGLSPEDKKATVIKIHNVMNTLGEIGCLKAIWLSVNDDCDILVAQEALTSIDVLDKIDAEFGFIEHLINGAVSEEKEFLHSERRMKPEVFFYDLLIQNWRADVESRRAWMADSCENMDSLLDYIIQDSDSPIFYSDHNALDCY